MKLIRICIKNFGVVEAVDYCPGPRVNVLVGDNGEGKTTVGRAILAGLTGRTDRTDRRGAGLNNELRLGAKKGSVELTFSDGKGDLVTFSRPIPQQGAHLLQEGIEDGFDCSTDEIEACLRTRWLSELSGTEQQTILYRVLAAGATDERILQELKAISEAAAAYFAKHIKEAKTAPNGYKSWAEMERAAVKKQHAAAGQKLKVLEEQLGAPSGTPATEAQVKELRAQRDQLLQSLAQEQQASNSASQVYSAKRSEWEAKDQQKALLKRTLEAAVADGKATSDHLVQLGEAVSLPDVQEFLQQLAIEIEQAEAEKAACFAALNAASGTGKCARGHCARVEHADAIAAINGVEAKLRTLVEQRTENELLIRQAAAHNESLRESKVQLEQLQQKIANARSEFEAFTVPDPPTMPATADRLEQLQKERQLIENRLAGAEGSLRRHAEHQAAAKQVDNLRAEVKKLAEEVDVLEQLNQAFHPSGIKAKILGECMTDFTADVSRMLSQWFGGFQLRVERDPWQLMGKAPQGWLPVHFTSWSQRAIFSATLQVGIARATGFPLVVIDESGLTATYRPMLLEFLLAQEDVQSIVLSSLDQPPADPGVDGLVVFHVQGGRIIPVGAAATLEPALNT